MIIEKVVERALGSRWIWDIFLYLYKRSQRQILPTCLAILNGYMVRYQGDVGPAWSKNV